MSCGHLLRGFGKVPRSLTSEVLRWDTRWEARWETRQNATGLGSVQNLFKPLYKVCAEHVLVPISVVGGPNALSRCWYDVS